MKRFILIALVICTLAGSLIVAPDNSHAQAISQHTARTEHTALQPMQPKLNIKSYWDGTLVTLNPMDMRLLASGSFALIVVISALPGAAVWLGVGRGSSALSAWNASNAYIHGQCYWFWITTYKPDWGTYPCH